MKKIALLADGWRRYVTYSWVEGIMEGSKELGLDVCLFFTTPTEPGVKIQSLTKASMR